MNAKETILLANKMKIPATTKAVLWDMDGVLIDSLGLDLSVVNELLKKYFGERVQLTREYIQSIFAFSVPDFWRMILEKVAKESGIAAAQESYAGIMSEYEAVRQKYSFQLCPEVREVLDAAREAGLKLAVVSNNPTAQVKEILGNVGIVEEFDFIVGNDVSVEQKSLRKKPAPDTYLFALQQLGVSADQCVVVEDSVIGAEAGKAAGCFVVGVATGGATYEELLKLGTIVDRVYESLV